MTIKPNIKGYGFALLATVAGSTVYIFSKAALEQVSLPQFGVYWFGMAIVWNTLFAFRKAENRKLKSIARSSLKILLLLGCIEIVATGTFYASISVSANPAIPSFLRNMEYIFVTIMGVILLGERFTTIEAIGVMLTFSGAIVISYQKGATLESFLTGSAGLMLVSTIFYGVRTITAKNHIKSITPIMLALNRALFLLVFAVIMLLVFGQVLVIPLKAFYYIAAGSFFGPFLTSLGQYSALKYLEASRSAIIQSTTALFVLLGAYLFFGKFPLGYQVVGGILTIAGPLLLVIGKKFSPHH